MTFNATNAQEGYFSLRGMKRNSLFYTVMSHLFSYWFKCANIILHHILPAFTPYFKSPHDSCPLYKTCANIWLFSKSVSLARCRKQVTKLIIETKMISNTYILNKYFQMNFLNISALQILFSVFCRSVSFNTITISSFTFHSNKHW